MFKKRELLMCALAIISSGVSAQIEDTCVYAPTKIITSEKIVGILSDSENWKTLSTHIGFRAGGAFPVEAEAEVSIDPSPDNFISNYFPYKIPNAPHYKKLDVNIESSKSKLERFNRISLLVYPDMPDRAALWIEAQGSPTWLAASFPLQPKKWNKIFLDLSHLKPEQRPLINKIMIGGTPLGRLPNDPQWQRYYLKDLCFEQILPRNNQGWEVSDRYVSISQVGFTPWQRGKKAIFSGALKSAMFQIRNVADNSIRYKGKTTELTNSFGAFKIADFSDFSEPGEYAIESGDTRSSTFPITETPFEKAIEKYTYYLSCMRSGVATPAHPLCFQDDTIREDTKERVDLRGGWFDASDVRIYNSMSMTHILRPLSIASGFFPAGAEASAFLRDEARWGAEFFNKIWDTQTGLPFTMLCVHMPRTEKYAPVKTLYYKNNNYWTDNKPGTEDDRVVHTPWNSEYIDGALDNYAQHLGICAAGANFLTAFKSNSDDRFMSTMLEHTERHYNRMRDEKYVREHQKILPGANMNDTAPLALSLEIETQLANLTQKQEYRMGALRSAAALLQRQQFELIETEKGEFITGYFDKNTSYIPSLIGRPAAPVDSLLRLLESDIQVGDYFAVYAALKINADYYVKKIYNIVEPYCLPSWLTVNKTTNARFLGTAKNATQTKFYIGGYAWEPHIIGLESSAIMRQAAFLSDSELYTIALQMLQAQVGLNPRSQSFIVEVGEDFKPDVMSTTLGYIPGMMSIGIQMKNGEPVFPQQYGYNEIYTQVTPYLQALAMAHSPCRLSGKIMQPEVSTAGKKVRIANREFGKEYVVTTDRNGAFSDVLLSGGLTYEIRSDDRLIGRIFAVGGMKKYVNCGLSGGYELTRVLLPGKVTAGTTLTAKLEIVNHGIMKQIAQIEAHGFNVTPVEKTVNRTLTPGTNFISFAFQASTKFNIPYVVMFSKDARHEGIASAVDVILGPLPPPVVPIEAKGIPAPDERKGAENPKTEFHFELKNAKAVGKDKIPAGWKKHMGPGVIDTLEEDGVNLVEIDAEKSTQMHSDLFPVVSGTEISLEFESKSVGASVLPTAGIHLYDVDGNWLKCEAKSYDARTNNWKKFSLSLTIPNEAKGKKVAKCSVAVGIYGGGAARFQKIAMRIKMPSTVRAGNANEIDVNGTFRNSQALDQDRIPFGWKKIQGPGVVDTLEEEGGSLVRINAEKTIQLHSRLFDVRAGNTIKFEFEAISVSEKVLPIAGIHLYDPDGKWLVSEAKSYFSKRDEWKKFELSSLVPDEYKGKKIGKCTVCIGINGSGTAKFKKASVRIASEDK